MIEPLSLDFDLRCDVEHAFDVWTTRTSLWWPAGHSVSAAPGLRVTIEPWVGGRIFERTPEGIEHDWGEVTLWDPPTHLAYLWHLGADRAAATEVAIRFVAQGAVTTRIEIEHRGWERLGEAADQWRDRNRVGWDTLLPHYLAQIEKGER